LLFSKGHSCLALYHTLAHRGFFDPELLKTYGQNGAAVAGHPERGRLPGIEISSGSLGHGPAIGVGVALAGRLSGRSYRTFVIVGDGECNEGAVWEAMMAASQLCLGRFCLVVDNNGMESLGRTQDIVSLDPLTAKLASFGADVQEIDGHDFPSLVEAFTHTNIPGSRPRAIVLNTNKGHGVDFMTNVAKWHYRAPDEAEYTAALGQLEALTHA
jgi:transketolase